MLTAHQHPPPRHTGSVEGNEEEGDAGVRTGSRRGADGGGGVVGVDAAAREDGVSTGVSENWREGWSALGNPLLGLRREGRRRRTREGGAKVSAETRRTEREGADVHR